MGLTLAFPVPSVDRGLQGVALGEQVPIEGGEVLDDGGEIGPKGGGLDFDPGNDFFVDQCVQVPIHLQAVGFDSLVHFLKTSMFFIVFFALQKKWACRPDMPVEIHFLLDTQGIG